MAHWNRGSRRSSPSPPASPGVRFICRICTFENIVAPPAYDSEDEDVDEDEDEIHVGDFRRRRPPFLSCQMCETEHRFDDPSAREAELRVEKLKAEQERLRAAQEVLARKAGK